MTTKRGVKFIIKGSSFTNPISGYEGGSCPIDKLAELVLSSSINPMNEFTIQFDGENGGTILNTYYLYSCPFCDYDFNLNRQHDQVMHREAHAQLHAPAPVNLDPPENYCREHDLFDCWYCAQKSAPVFSVLSTNTGK